RYRQIGWCAPEHVGEHDDTAAGVDPPHGLDELGTPRLHVVFRPDGQGFELLLRPDDVLEGGTEFCGQPSMGDNDDADHRVMRILCGAMGEAPRRRMMIEAPLARQAERGTWAGGSALPGARQCNGKLNGSRPFPRG